MYSLTILGAGNVATHISRHLHFQGQVIREVWSRSEASARELAAEVGAKASFGDQAVAEGSDFYLLAVPDRGVAELARRHAGMDGIWLHCAGSIDREVLSPQFRQYGVLYPLQSLSKSKGIDMSQVPFLVEGSDAESTRSIMELAGLLSETIRECDSEERMKLHLAAVFANNFSMHMVYLASRILEAEGGDLSPLLPLLRESLAKIESMGPGPAMTGPAIRNDRQTMSRHLELLEGHPEWQKMYTFMSRSIQDEQL